MKKLHLQKRYVFLAAGIFAIVLVVVAAMAFIDTKQKHDPGTNSSSSLSAQNGQTEVPASGRLDLPSAQRLTRNTLRGTETNRLLANVAEFINNNSGQMPTMYNDGRLTSASADFPATSIMTHYRSVSFVSGEQGGVTDDSLRLVTGAKCGSDGRTVSGSSREYAAQYGFEEEGGTFSPRCVAG